MLFEDITDRELKAEILRKLGQIQRKSGRNVSKWKNEVLFVDPRLGLEGNGKCVDTENHKTALR